MTLPSVAQTPPQLTSGLTFDLPAGIDDPDCLEAGIIEADATAPRIDPQATAVDLADASRAQGDGECCAFTSVVCCVPTGLVALNAAMGALMPTVGAAVMDSVFGQEEYGDLRMDATRQGAVGGAVIGAGIGACVAPIIGCVAAADGLGNNNNSSCAMNSLILSAVGAVAANALGNVILAAEGFDTTSQAEGAIASAVGVGTFAAASAGVGFGLCCCWLAASCGVGVGALARQ